MYLLDGLKIDIAAQRTVAETQYPRGWFLDADNRAAMGITEVPDPVYPDDTLFTTSENPDGSLTATPRSAEEIVANQANTETMRVATLWQAAHDYEFAQISGTAVGLLVIGVMQGLPVSLAIKAWSKAIWVLYYTRKATGSTDYDYSPIGPCPHTVPELMTELGE